MRAFTLIELITVIIIIGILATIGASSFKPKYIIDDVNFIHAKIKEAQFLGLGHERLAFGGGLESTDKTGCITIEKASLESSATQDEQNYKLHVEIENRSTFAPIDTICFDAKGRPHHTDFTTEPLLERAVFSFSYGGEERNITIEPLTGYSRIVY